MIKKYRDNGSYSTTTSMPSKYSSPGNDQNIDPGRSRGTLSMQANFRQRRRKHRFSRDFSLDLLSKRIVRTHLQANIDTHTDMPHTCTRDIFASPLIGDIFFRNVPAKVVFARVTFVRRCSLCPGEKTRGHVYIAVGGK